MRCAIGEVAGHSQGAVRQDAVQGCQRVTAVGHQRHPQGARQGRIMGGQQGIEARRNARLPGKIDFASGCGLRVMALQNKIQVDGGGGRIVTGNNRIDIGGQHIAGTTRARHEFDRLKVAAAGQVDGRAIRDRDCRGIDDEIFVCRRGQRLAIDGIIAPARSVGGLAKRHRLTVQRHRRDASRPEPHRFGRNHRIGGGIARRKIGLALCAKPDGAERRQQNASLIDRGGAYREQATRRQRRRRRRTIGRECNRAFRGGRFEGKIDARYRIDLRRRQCQIAGGDQFAGRQCSGHKIQRHIGKRRAQPDIARTDKAALRRPRDGQKIGCARRTEAACRNIDHRRRDPQHAFAGEGDDLVGIAGPAQGDIARIQADIASSGIGRRDGVGERDSRCIQKKPVQSAQGDIAVKSERTRREFSLAGADRIAGEGPHGKCEVLDSRAAEAIGKKHHRTCQRAQRVGGGERGGHAVAALAHGDGFKTLAAGLGRRNGERTAIAACRPRMGREGSVIQQGRRCDRDGARIAPHCGCNPLRTGEGRQGVLQQIENAAAAGDIDRRTMQANDRSAGIRGRDLDRPARQNRAGAKQQLPAVGQRNAGHIQPAVRTQPKCGIGSRGQSNGAAWRADGPKNFGHRRLPGNGRRKGLAALAAFVSGAAADTKGDRSLRITCDGGTCSNRKRHFRRRGGTCRIIGPG